MTGCLVREKGGQRSFTDDEMIEDEHEEFFDIPQ